MKIVLKRPRWELILILSGTAMITILGPKPESFNFGAFMLGYFVSCQTSVFPDAAGRRFRWLAAILGIWAVLDSFHIGAAMINKPSYMQAFMLGSGGYGALGSYEPFTLFSADIDSFNTLVIEREQFKEPFHHWGIVVGIVSLVLTVITKWVPIMLVGFVIALIVQKIRRER